MLCFWGKTRKNAFFQGENLLQPDVQPVHFVHMHSVVHQTEKKKKKKKTLKKVAMSEETEFLRISLILHFRKVTTDF